MKEYTGFAQVYDMFMSDIPYDEWTDAVAGILCDNGIRDGLVLDLGCGTGNITQRLSNAGYDMIGVDSSPEMLQLAQEKNEDGSILYLLQEMQAFELYGTVRAVVSLCDSMNYLTESCELENVLSLVNNYLDPGGIFVFDMKTEYFYSEVLGNSTICDNREDASLIWENYYDESEGLNEYDITVYCRSQEQCTNDREQLYRRFEEVHFQRAYSIGFVTELIKKAGLEFEGAFNAFDGTPASGKSERVYFVARECTKNR